MGAILLFSSSIKVELDQLGSVPGLNFTRCSGGKVIVYDQNKVKCPYPGHGGWTTVTQSN